MFRFGDKKRERESDNEEHDIYDDMYDIEYEDPHPIEFGRHYVLLKRGPAIYQITMDGISPYYLFKTEIKKDKNRFQKGDIIRDNDSSKQEGQRGYEKPGEYIVYKSKKHNRLQLQPFKKTLDEEFPDLEKHDNKKHKNGGQKNKSKKGGKTRKSKKGGKTRKNRK